MTMPYYDCEATYKAVKNFTRDRSAPQPCRHESGRVGNIVTLRNVRGVLARYRVKPDGTMRRLATIQDAH